MARENTSMTKATYTKPSQVATWVMSATQSWLGLVATNSRCTSSAGRAAFSSGVVVIVNALPRTTPRSPSTFISRSTVVSSPGGPFPSSTSARFTHSRSALSVRSRSLATCGMLLSPERRSFEVHRAGSKAAVDLANCRPAAA